MKISVNHVLALVSLAACSAKVSTPPPELLRVQIPSEPGHLNPYLAETGAEMAILRHLVRTPLRYGEQNEVEGDAAESYAWLEQGLQLKLVFRADLKWSDSSPLTACHYRAGILRMLGKGTGIPSPFSDLYRGVLGYSMALRGDFSAMDRAIVCTDRELSFKLSRAQDRNVLHALSFLGSAPWKERLDPLMKISSGRFYVQEWRKGRSILIAAVEPEKFLSPRFEFLFIRDADTALIMYEKNDLEILTELPPTLLPKLRTRPDFRRTSMLATYYVAFGVRSGRWTSDRRFRRALALSAGREELPSILQGGERAAYTFTPDELLPASELASFRKQHSEDPQEAKRLWQAALADHSGPKPKQLTLGYPAGSRHLLIMERLANNWKRHLDVEVSFEPQEWNHYVDILKKKTPEIFRYAWTAVYPDPRFFLNLFESTSRQNFGNWNSSEYDAQLVDLEKMDQQGADFSNKVLAAEQRLVWDEAALIPLYHYTKLFMARGEVGAKLKFTYQGFVDVTSLTKAQ